MKFPFLAKVLVVNAVLIMLVYLVSLDVAARNAYASVLNFAPSTSYSILFHTLTLTGRGTVLTSPATLDWFQLLVLIAVAADAYMLRGYFKRTSAQEQPSTTSAETAPRLDQGSLKDLSLPPSESQIWARRPRREG